MNEDRRQEETKNDHKNLVTFHFFFFLFSVLSI